MAEAPRRARASWVHAVSLLLAVLVALPSLAYPFGRDQGLYFYVGREWLRGALPYRDLFEQKTPGIYVLHTTCIALFGERLWGIRLADVVAVALIGVLAGSLDRARPVRAAAVLGSSILYFGFLDFWDTAQCEVWCALFVMATLFVVERGPPTSRFASIAGLLFGLALVMKPPIAVFAPMLGACIRRRGWMRRLWAVALAASLVPWLATLAYFAARGGLGALVDVLVHANGFYVAHETVDVTDAFTLLFEVLRQYAPVSTFLLYATFALAWIRRRDRDAARPYRLVVASTLSAFAMVAVQRKFYPYHFVVLMVPAPLAVAALAREAEERWAWGSAIVLAHAIGLFVLSGTFEHQWLATALDFARYRAGAVPRSKAYGRFTYDTWFDTNESEAVAAWLRDHAAPGDRLCARGFEPQLYAMTGMRCPSRFFWTPWLVDASRSYRRADYLAEDRTALDRDPPRFVTVKTEAGPGGADSEEYMAALGYARVTQIGAFVVMERAE